MARYFKARLLVCALIILTLLTGLVLSSSYTKAGDDKSPDDAVSCTIAYTEGTSRSVSMTNGSYLADIGNSTMQTICDDASGYAIYTVGYSNDEFGNNNMIATINGVLNPTYNIASSNASSGNTSAWAMKANAITGLYAPTIDNEFGEYRAIPEEYTRLAYLTDTTDDTTGSSINLTYAIYVSSTQPAGTYVGKVKYTLVHPHDETPCVEGKICYHKNANNVVGSMGRQNATGATAMLMASNFSHEGYGFAGWNTEEDGTGTSYGPNETITLPSDMSEGLNLYAMWVKSAGSLQDWGGCYSMNIGDVTALTDERDNDTYAIAKLADGKCWMIENLRLDNDATTGSVNEALAQGYGTSTTYGNFAGLANPEAPWIGDSTTANSLYSIDGSDGTINIGADNDPARRFPRYNNQNTASRDNYPTTNQNIYSYGNYYTWAAAIADLNPNNTNNQITTGTSLCPTGWRLPSGGAAYASDSTTGVNVTGDTATYRDFYNLGYKIMDEIKTAYEDTVGSEGAYYSDNTTNLVGDTATKAFRKYPNNFVLSGYVYNGSINNRNSFGFYWSSTARNTDYAYRLYINTSTVYPSTAGGNKYYGRSVRCVTASVARQNVTVNFDEKVESVTLHSDEFGSKTVTTSGTVVQLPENTEYTISGTYSADYGFERWQTTSKGTLGSTTSAETTYAVSGAATLTLYSKKVCSQGYICYDKNNRDTDAPGGDMGNQAVSGTSATLWASNYGREGYGFAGWNTSADGTGTSYGPNETITFDPTNEDGLMLYAMWVAPHGTLQSFTCTNKSLPVGMVIGLTDERDQQVYAVAKLADGKCWMIENLRIENYSTMTPSQKDLSQGYGGVFDGLAAPELDTFADVTTSNSLYDNRDVVGNNVSSRIPRYRDDNKRNAIAKMTSENQQVYSYGNYYNFPATIANTTDFTSQGEITTTSLCPTGWRIPSGGSKGYKDDSDYWALTVDALNEGITPTSSGGNIYDGDAVATNLSNTIRRYPNNFLNSGHVENGSSMNGKGGRGDYWSATNGDNDEAFRFSFRFNGVNPGTSPLHKYKGLAVRCVTGTVTKQTVTVNFDDGVSSVSLQSDRFGKYTVTTSGSTVKLADGVDYTISATYNTEKGFDGWTTTANGTLGSTTSAETTYAVSGVATLALASKRICIEGYICYDKNHNDANAPGGDMANQQVSDIEANLWANNFGRNGYGFAGWNTAADGTGTSYGPNETITFDPTDPDGLMLYAMWVESEGNLQGWSCPNNYAMPIGTVIGLTDTRDGQVYAVAKLADGNCWTIENLRLADKDSSNNAVALNSTNTNNPSLPLTNNNGGTSNSLSASQDPATNAWCTSNDSACDDKSMIFTGNATNSVANMTDADQNVYAYGNYYNWYSATAGNGTFNTGTGVVVGGDICPSGWFLPYGDTGTGNKGGNTSGGYYYLGVALNATSNNGDSSKVWRSYPNNFVNASSITGVISARGRGGLYWASRSVSNGSANSLSFDYDSMNAGTGSNSKHQGRTVRCVTKANSSVSINDLNYMQDFAELSSGEKTEVLNSMSSGQQYQLADSRDNKVYYISKLADGNVWMTQNLDYDIVNGGADINSTNTDVPTSWTGAGSLANTRATSDHNWNFSYSNPESYDPGDVCWDGVITTDQFQTLTDHGEACNQNNGHYHVGNYYNWTAAVARSDSSSDNVDGNNVEQSICPSGWTLPKSGSNADSGSFAYLVNEAGLTPDVSGNAHTAPAYFSYSGAWQGSSVFVGYGGFHWSSTAKSDYAAYSLNITPYIVSPNSGSERLAGYSVRCIVKN